MESPGSLNYNSPTILYIWFSPWASEAIHAVQISPLGAHYLYYPIKHRSIMLCNVEKRGNSQTALWFIALILSALVLDADELELIAFTAI